MLHPASVFVPEFTRCLLWGCCSWTCFEILRWRAIGVAGAASWASCQLRTSVFHWSLGSDTLTAPAPPLLATVHKCCLWLHSHNRTTSCSKPERHMSCSGVMKSRTAELRSSGPSQQKSSSVPHNLPCPMHYPSPCSLSLSLDLRTGWVTGEWLCPHTEGTGRE